ncbi:MAG: glycoside hydrolase family 30 protein [Gammaproteobacteria bacterium]
MKRYSGAPRLAAVVIAVGLYAAVGAPVRAQTVAIDPAVKYQLIRGFGGFNGAGWIADLTGAQLDTAFGTGAGQIGLSIMRMRIDPSSSNWSVQLPSARAAAARGVTLFASPWSPPAYMKTNNNLVSGHLSPTYYGTYTSHLLDFANYMRANGAPLYALSVQNEPDWDASYEGCQWTSAEMIAYLKEQGARFSSVKLMGPESLNFSKSYTDPILNDAGAAGQLDIVAGHLYGVAPSDYPLARQKGKELWMTEHFTDNGDANDWTKAMPVALELHQSMVSNHSAYMWWYIRRAYGLLTEDGKVSKRGFIIAHYARHVRPGFRRIAATEKPYADVLVTAYRNDANGKLVVIVTNSGAAQRQVQLRLPSGTPGAAGTFTKYRTSATFNHEYAGQYGSSAGVFTAYVDPGSVNTFVSQ